MLNFQEFWDWHDLGPANILKLSRGNRGAKEMLSATQNNQVIRNYIVALAWIIHKSIAKKSKNLIRYQFQRF